MPSVWRFFYYYCLKITIFIINIINSFISMKKLLTFFLTALLAFSVGWAGEVIDVLDVSLTGITTENAYTDFSGIVGTSGAVYAGQCARYANYSESAIQLRSKNSNSGIVTTGSGGKVKSITVEWNSNTQNGRTLNVYGKNSAYSAATDLFDDNSGTLLGTIVYNTSNSLTITGDYEYIGFRSSSGALFLNSVSIVWETGSSDGPAKPTFSIGGSTVTGGQAVDLGTVVTISAEAGNTLAYTVDGTDPSASSTAEMTDGNTTQVTITEDCTIRAIAKDADANVSEESSINISLTALAVTLSPSSQTAEVGETIDVNLSANALGDIIYDFTSTPAGATVTGTGDAFSITATAAGAYTVTVHALDEAGRETTATGTYTFTKPSSGNWYKKVTSASDLVHGKKYIVVYEETPAFMGGFSATSTKYAFSITGPTISDDRVDIAGNDNIKELTLTKNGNNLSFHNGDGYLKWSSGNSLDIENSITDNSRWTASGNETDGYQLTNVFNSSRILQYNKNKGQERFACYTGNQQTAVLYVQDTNDPYLTISPESKSVELPVGASSVTAQFTVNGGNLTDDVTVTASGDGFTASPATLTAAQVQEGATVTVTYNGTVAATGTVTVTSGTTQAQATMIVTQAVPTAPVITLAADPCYDDQTVTITAQEGTTIYYTTDGSEPTPASTPYSGEFTIAHNSENTTVKAIAVNGTQTSTVATQSFAWGTVTVSLNPADGSTFQGSTMTGTVTVNPSDAQVSLTGATYNADDHTFTATVSTVGAMVTVEATATKGQSTATASATYTRVAADAPAAPTFSVAAGAVAAGTQLVISAPEGCTLVVNGQAVENPYTVTIDNAMTLEAYCVNDENLSSATVTNFYTISGGSGSSSDIYEKVTNAELVDGGTYILVHENGANGSIVMGSLNNNNKGTAVEGITLDTSASPYQVNLNGASALELTAHETSTSGEYTFEAGNGYLSNTSSTDLKIATSSNNWIVAANGQSGYYIHHMVGTTDRGVLYNGTVFGGYAMSNAGNNGYSYAYLYEKKSGTPAVVVEAPEITPADGTYYSDLTVTMTAQEGTTIYYTTDGSNPTTQSNVYNGEFTTPCEPGTTMIIKAIAINADGVASEVTTVTYAWATPVVTINPASGNYADDQVTVSMTATPADATIYYSTDGSEPATEYSGALVIGLPNVGDAVTVSAVAVVDGKRSAVATATYTRVEKIIDVNAPFFSPLSGETYYGDQTLQMGSTTPNAEIYYIIDVTDIDGNPTKSSTYYDGSQIDMTVGNTYHVKAIAYIGNFASTISEATYTIKSKDEFEGVSGVTYVANIAEFNALGKTSATIGFMNPIQVVHMSTYQNNGRTAEFCYIRDNSDYGCVYFGKNNTTYTRKIFERGDWIDGTQVRGLVNVWENNFHNQMGSSEHSAIKSWPSSRLGWSEIIPETTTTDVITEGTATGENKWGHYVHLRNTSVDVNTVDDGKYKGSIVDLQGTTTYYDKFYRWSGLTHSLGNYDQTFFGEKEENGATFDVYGIVDYYNPDAYPFQLCPIDFLWIYKPVISQVGGEYATAQEVTISVADVEWAPAGAQTPVIYYKTSDMEEWAEYTPGQVILVNSTTTLSTYAEIPSLKSDGTNYNDYIHSVTVDSTYTIVGVNAPSIDQPTQVIEVKTGNESLSVTVTDNNQAGSGAVTVYTINGVTSPDVISAGSHVQMDITQTTTITAISYKVIGEGDTLWSQPVIETYTFARSNGIEYTLLKSDPVEGDIYVIVNKAANMGLSNTQNASNRASTAVLFKEEDKNVVYGNDELAQFVLEKVSEDRYYFRSLTGNGGYLTVETNDHANLVTSAVHDASGYDVAGVTVTAGSADVDKSYPATITFTYEGTKRYMRYYAGGRVFSTYAQGTLNDDVFLYGAHVTPLHVIERDMTPSTDVQVTVSDKLVGVWAAKNILWAKDQGYLSIDATQIREGEQQDYVKMAKLKSTTRAFQTDEWDQSNWVMLDFTGTGEDASEYVGYEFANNSVIGYYVDDLNYRIELAQAPTRAGKMDGYIGYNQDPVDMADAYRLNHYVSSNFYEPNLNWGPYSGAHVGEGADPVVGDTCFFFMNPKVGEIAQVFAVWHDAGYFTIFEPQGVSVNGYDLTGAFNVDWTYNRRADSGGDEVMFGPASGLERGAVYLFHVAVMRDNYNYGHRKATTDTRLNAVGPAIKETGFSNSMRVYPLDLMSNAEPNPTSIEEVAATTAAARTVESVRYYSVMGVESDRPMEGINIVVTRYSDGSVTTAKVLR